jgi:hypothetical protein
MSAVPDEKAVDESAGRDAGGIGLVLFVLLMLTIATALGT